MGLRFDICIRTPASMEKTYSSQKEMEDKNICGFTYRRFMGNISFLPLHDLVILTPSVFRTATLRHWEILQILRWVEEPRLGLSLCFSATSEVRLPTVLRPVPAGTGHVHSCSSWGHWGWLEKTYTRSRDVSGGGRDGFSNVFVRAWLSGTTRLLSPIVPCVLGWRMSYLSWSTLKEQRFHFYANSQEL